MVVKVTNNGAHELSFRRIFRNADRIWTVFGANSCEKTDTGNGVNAKSFYHGLFRASSHLGGRKLLRNDFTSGPAISKHLLAGRPCTVRLCHRCTGGKKKPRANGQSCEPDHEP